jgi:acetoacetyl-CoA reductase/3-oxoacyl-[acyl-carrier protein] reductase
MSADLNRLAGRMTALGLRPVIDPVLDIVLRRLGRPEEIARVVHFLCADASAYITGQVWGVNGGLEM